MPPIIMMPCEGRIAYCAPFVGLSQLVLESRHFKMVPWPSYPATPLRQKTIFVAIP